MNFHGQYHYQLGPANFEEWIQRSAVRIWQAFFHSKVLWHTVSGAGVVGLIIS